MKAYCLALKVTVLMTVLAAFQVAAAVKSATKSHRRRVRRICGQRFLQLVNKICDNGSAFPDVLCCVIGRNCHRITSQCRKW